VPVIVLEEVRDAMVESCSAPESSPVMLHVKGGSQPGHYSCFEPRFETNPRGILCGWRIRASCGEADLIQWKWEETDHQSRSCRLLASSFFTLRQLSREDTERADKMGQRLRYNRGRRNKELWAKSKLGRLCTGWPDRF